MWTRSGCLLFLAVLSGLMARADGISISPTTVILEPGRNIGALTLRNQGKTDVTYELAGYRWTQADGEDVLTLDKSFIVTPPVISLAAGEARVIRVGLLQEDAGTSVEQAYRLRISEMAAPENTAGANLNVRLQVLLPVFTRRADIDPRLEFSAYRTDTGRTCIDGQNLGRTHAKLAWVANPDGMDETVPVQKYILANSEGTLCLDIPFETGRKLIVAATSAHMNDVRPYEIPVTGP